QRESEPLILPRRQLVSPIHRDAIVIPIKGQFDQLEITIYSAGGAAFRPGADLESQQRNVDRERRYPAIGAAVATFPIVLDTTGHVREHVVRLREDATGEIAENTALFQLR